MTLNPLTLEGPEGRDTLWLEALYVEKAPSPELFLALTYALKNLPLLLIWFASSCLVTLQEYLYSRPSPLAIEALVKL